MLIVGELINASHKVISDAIEAQDAEAMAGKDNFCMSYLKAYRNKKLET